MRFNSDTYGAIYKKSQFLGNWALRYMVLNKEGLFSFKNFN